MISDKDFLLNLDMFFITQLHFHFVILFSCQNQQSLPLQFVRQTGSSTFMSVGGLKIIVQHQHLSDKQHVRQD